LINIEEIKKKYLIPSEIKIAICNADEIKEMVLLLDQQQQQLAEAYKELQIANDMIRELKTLKRVKKVYELEQNNLEFAQENSELLKKLKAANQEVERLQVVAKAYDAYKKAH
jgi:hypothetical protein